jgi:hypothetical protein
MLRDVVHGWFAAAVKFTFLSHSPSLAPSLDGFLRKFLDCLFLIRTCVALW